MPVICLVMRFLQGLLFWGGIWSLDQIHWILMNWIEGLCLSTRELVFQFRENLGLQGRETHSGYLRQKKEGM